MTRALPILLLACGPKEEPGMPVVVEPVCSNHEYIQPPLPQSDLLIVVGTDGRRLEDVQSASPTLAERILFSFNDFRLGMLDAATSTLNQSEDGVDVLDRRTADPVGVFGELLDGSSTVSGSEVHDSALAFLTSDDSFHRAEAELHLLLIHDGQTTDRDAWLDAIDALPRQGRLTVSAIAPETDGDVALTTLTGGLWSDDASLVQDYGTLLDQEWSGGGVFELPADANLDTLEVWVDDGDFTYQGVNGEALTGDNFQDVCQSVCFEYEVRGSSLILDEFVPSPGATIRLCW